MKKLFDLCFEVKFNLKLAITCTIVKQIFDWLLPLDFQDIHHTCFKGKYGSNGFWDRGFNKLNTPRKKRGIMFRVSLIESHLNKWLQKNTNQLKNS
ncbi:sterol desaturase [Microseira wollei NIES-4236]|uniref:Sterol desaturase n=1 Tax=Microseira wollei NIES-4236 TaxID=2530354 RepID=A0AAV3X8X5_9CYAN|nr:sterol desaturase [Microseira wollei NIES-4236]